MGKFDVCVIGAGPGGYVAAIHAGRKGKKVALIEKQYFGGTCLNVGCIPTKTLIASAESLKSARHAEDFGVKIEGNISYSWDSMQNRKNGIIEKLRSGIGSLLKNSNVEVLNGTASFKSRNSLTVKDTEDNEKTVETDKIIIATGSKPAMPAFIPKSPRVLDSTDLLNIDEVPKSIIVLGGGVIGCEFACLLNELGSEVKVVEMLSNVLPGQDTEVCRQLTREMKKRKIKVMVGKPMENISADENGVKGTVKNKEIGADYLLVSIGRVPVTEVLNPQAAGVAVDEKGFIRVDNSCRTNVEGIYAVGDVTGRIQLAHLASAMALTAAENACGNNDSFSDCLVPGCIFTDPEIGTVGLTEEQCREHGIEIKIGKFPYSALGKAMAINEITGFCKIITDVKTDRILGVHIIGAHATDLISEAVTAMEKGITAEELGKAIHAHPTLGEIMMEAAHAAHDKSVHLPAAKK
ncbi:MAG: dihydrolipoyl dehydrogenase [Victivallales bacterium]|nr:dihydrolipoyl dehydrogenase [Victivallales bacterium]